MILCPHPCPLGGAPLGHADPAGSSGPPTEAESWVDFDALKAPPPHTSPHLHQDVNKPVPGQLHAASVSGGKTAAGDKAAVERPLLAKSSLGSQEETPQISEQEKGQMTKGTDAHPRSLWRDPKV